MKPRVESADSEIGRYSRDLIVVLANLERLHAQLAELIDVKIERMRRCDVAGMNECVSGEQELVGKIGEQEGLRRMLTDRMGRGYGMSPQKARRLTACQLAEVIPPPQRDELRDLATRLEALMTRIVRRNRIASQLSGGILAHMDAILSAMISPQVQAGAYSKRGSAVDATPQRLFETVG
ncbi:MAG: flagellar export chaperone FlgN [Planctomycetota bacterium]